MLAIRTFNVMAEMIKGKTNDFDIKMIFVILKGLDVDVFFLHFSTI